jgi:hypothetical protein
LVKKIAPIIATNKSTDVISNGKRYSLNNKMPISAGLAYPEANDLKSGNIPC